MKKNTLLFICSIGLLAALQVLNACAEKREPLKIVTEQVSAEHSNLNEATEEKLDNLLTDYVDDMKRALAEPDDKKAAAKIQQMKSQYSTRIEELQVELEAWENSLSEEETRAFQQRMENKPYFKDLFTTSLSAMGRMTKSPEFRKAFEDLNSNLNFINEDLSIEEATGEEYPEDNVEEQIE
jgi:Skp family chaperone for outer membrane proteins